MTADPVSSGTEPSAEAVEAATCWYVAGMSMHAALTAAYAIDEARIRAEAEQALLARIVEFLRHADDDDRHPSKRHPDSLAADRIEAEFGGDAHGK